MVNKAVQILVSALSGWAAGLLIVLGFSFLWLKIIPVVDRAGQGPGFWKVLTFIFLLISPVAIAGGIIGGRLPKEGGRLNQLVYAALFGLFFPLPFACFLLWYTGF